MPPMFRHRRFRLSRSHKKKDKYSKKKPPVRRGQLISLYIKDVSSKGDGVGKYDDFAVFVPGAEEGEKVRVKITEVKKNCAVGKIIKIGN